MFCHFSQNSFLDKTAIALDSHWNMKNMWIKEVLPRHSSFSHYKLDTTKCLLPGVITTLQHIIVLAVFFKSNRCAIRINVTTLCYCYAMQVTMIVPWLNLVSLYQGIFIWHAFFLLNYSHVVRLKNKCLWITPWPV